ncbi:MAG: MGH1-like glycoside hydrolase domain-containing protein, partial [Candidatus Helarchaeota archaeon]
VAHIYEKTQDKLFLEKMFPALLQFYDWLHSERNEQISGDGLLSIIHPWESGMDLLPIWDNIHKIKRFFTLRTGLWLSRIIKRYNQVNWEIEKIKELNLFLVKDVSFNVIYTLNLQALANLCAELGQEEKKNLYLKRAAETEKALLEKCWDEETSFFYSIRSIEEEKLPELTISGLFPLTLNIDKKKIERLIQDHLLNEEEFWLPYPIPCVAKSSSKFRAKGSAMVLWRGPTWISTNWYIVKGLQHQNYAEYANQIIQKMRELIEFSGFREQYNPITAKGYGAKNFGWSTLIVDLFR